MKNNLQPTLAALKGSLGSPAALMAAVQLAPDMLMMGSGTNSSNVAVLRGLGVAEHQQWQAQWVRSERVQQYGLNGPAAAPMSQALA